MVQPRCVVDHESLLLILLTGGQVGRVRVCPWTYAYTLAAIHAVNMREVRKMKLHLLTINAPLIVKDEVDKVFELILFRNKTKNFMWGLRLIVVWDLPSRGP